MWWETIGGRVSIRYVFCLQMFIKIKRQDINEIKINPVSPILQPDCLESSYPGYSTRSAKLKKKQIN